MQSLVSVRLGYLPKVGFDKIAVNVRDSGVYISLPPKKPEIYSGDSRFGDLQDKFGYIETWLNISQEFGRISYFIRV